MTPRNGIPVVVENLESRRHLAAATASLTHDDVTLILAQAASQTQSANLSKAVIVVSDRDGNVLGTFVRSGNDSASAERTEIALLATGRARTAALFQSSQNAFTTRTARFIIQDHFPHPVNGTPGGPLYGVEFSNLPGSDVVSNAPAILGDPGGIPLYKNGVPVGGIGVAGDFSDVGVRKDVDITRAYNNNPDGRVFNGKEESDVDEQIALAGAQGYMAPEAIRATTIFLDGLRLPFTADEPASGFKYRRLRDLIAANVGQATFSTADTPAYVAATIAGADGLLKRPVSASNGATKHNFGFEGSNDDSSIKLTSRDVRRIIEQAVTQTLKTRAAIRQPLGVPAQVHVSVVDRDGDILGVFRIGDAPNFGYDVSVQKARTAGFFSDNRHAFSTRAIGFLSQKYFPIGIEDAGTGPLFQMQNELFNLKTLSLKTPTDSGVKNPLKNGITIFPGGIPLYKNGQYVGAIGVSGDGVDQDDVIAFAGSAGYGPAARIRSDRLAKQEIRDFITARAGLVIDLFGVEPTPGAGFEALSKNFTIDHVIDRFADKDAFDFQLPYVKFPRNLEV